MKWLIPLTKVKTMRKTLSEKPMLNNFLKEHAYRLHQISSPGSNIMIHPLPNPGITSVIKGCELHSDAGPSGRTLPSLTPIDFSHLSHRILSQGRQCSFCWEREKGRKKHPLLYLQTVPETFRTAVAVGCLGQDKTELGTLGAVKGFRTLQIGDLVSTDQPFGLSVAECGFAHVPFDGVLGLNYPNIYFSGGIPIFDNLKNQGAISEPGALNWIPLTQAGDWHINMDRISMKRQVIACSGGCEALVDTGTSLILGPTRLVNNIQKLIGATPRGSHHYVSYFVVNILPSIIFTINGINYPVPAQAYILKFSWGPRVHRAFSLSELPPGFKSSVLWHLPFLTVYKPPSIVLQATRTNPLKLFFISTI
ncbi:hypothetical protein FD754_001902 [Muntiacus muntjak]|uniref:Peptidase A1 domain-containing protein n=1 Tax=Muntiacus muntjak TaxID=9888 RepID=A0A5N3WBN5_MUNMU|nr:hypothetical protein FD754_001902 [Muntiacus muntjak]